MSGHAHRRYQFDRLIATGGMGEVWAATDTLLDREVAVKVLKPEYAGDETFRARLVAEARNAASLQHPNVAAVLDYGETDRGLPFLVMELVDGQPLSALLAGGRALPPEEATDLLAQAADGIGAAHDAGIVHRDVKPGNLLVTPDGRVLVTDFGIAQAADAVALTLTGHIVGTPHYLSPEQADGKAATPASDVYALGIVLFECLSGRKPFQGDSPVSTALMQIRDPLPQLPGSVPGRLHEITRVATAKDPAARYPDAVTFAAALRGEVPTQPILLPRMTAGFTAGTAVRSAAAAPWRRLVPVALLALLLVLGVGWALARDDDSPAVAGPSPSVSPRPAAKASPKRSAKPSPTRSAQPATTPVRSGGTSKAGSGGGGGGQHYTGKTHKPAPRKPGPKKHGPKKHGGKGKGRGHGKGHRGRR